MADPLFIEEELDWWGDVTPISTAPVVAVPRRRRRPPPRTLAGDLRRLSAWFENRSPIPVPAAGLLALALVAALAVVVRLAFTGADAQAPAATPAAAPVRAAAPASPAPVPAAKTAEPALLKEGARGAAVSDLQVALTALELFSGADGDYGPTTAAAVAAFQGSNGLAPDGVFGPATAAALQEALWERVQVDAATAGAGIAAAERDGRLEPATAEEARAAVAATVEAVGTQSPGRGAVLGLVLEDVAAAADTYTAGAAALFRELSANVRALGEAPPAFEGAGVSDAAGIVYRHVRDHGYRFHPLASFAKLNTLSKQGRVEEAGRLAAALVARGVRRGNTLLWEYRFPFGGPEVWTSGFTQAVAAQALARTGKQLGDQTLADTAAAAFRAIPRDLTLPVEGGDWIQEYSFSSMAVLNAHLQSIVSLLEYVELSGNEGARAYVTSLDETARTALDRFDTGCWSLYALDGKAATPGYHTYHVELLQRLGRRTGEPEYRETGVRWRGYLEAGGC